jgi:uncharacterized protein (TIGR00730 family)
MSVIRTVCVFCGSSTGSSGCYPTGAQLLGNVLADAGMDLVYGGSDVGLMGLVARTMLARSRRVTGIIPRALQEVTRPLDITELIIVDTMHERKAAMYERSDAFIALPGGIGTFEELLEAFTWSQLGYLKKPVAVLNINGYYDLLLQQLAVSVRSGFMKQTHLDGLLVHDDPNELVGMLQSTDYAYHPKWQ